MLWYLLPIGTSPASDGATPASIDSSTPTAFGAAVRQARRTHGLTQQDLADAIGVNRRVVSELERGKGTLRLEIALAAAAAVGLDVTVEPRA